MKILADANLKDVESYFSVYGDLTLVPGRDITKANIAEVDVLLVRSVTQVDERLLKDSLVRFVGTGTSGTDHIDLDFLQNAGIRFSHAHGSNAQAVVDYCLSALASVKQRCGEAEFVTTEIGIIGLGAVGGLLARQLLTAGCKVLAVDPLLTRDQQQNYERLGVGFVSLEQAFEMSCVSLHVPLTSRGNFSTRGMITENLLARLPSDCVFINASRGGVVRDEVLFRFLQSRQDVRAVLDVWESEPKPHPGLMESASILTPHIAGYSRNAKSLATEMLAKSFREYLLTTDNKNSEVGNGKNDDDIANLTTLIPGSIEDAVIKSLPLLSYSDEYKNNSKNVTDQAKVFDDYRRTMINRVEFSDFAIDPVNLNEGAVEILRAWGFTII